MSTIEIDGMAVSYHDRGVGEPVLLIPPAAARATVWRQHQVPALVAAGYRVLTYDLRHTRRSPEHPKPFALIDLVSDAAELITALGLGPCRLVGASLGAMIAQELALARPDLVRAACLLGTRGRADGYRSALGQGYAQAMRAVGRDTALFEAVASMSQLFGPATLADEDFVRSWLSAYELFRPGGEGAAAQYEATIGYDRVNELRGVRCPCLVVAFGHDVIMPPAEGAAVAKAIPSCRYVELPDCGHFGFVERPGEVNALITEFFAEGDQRA
ncbi:alpha/beta fold hydrolase [Amycolatopsis alba]|uniref:alpha/beta fold hydrolase n=1 Tax=Amycolatopsis alba TaxID=76020 RepID=UPI00047EC8CC|nr:alpha/beta hydrolase [Amycolatopsis alba]